MIDLHHIQITIFDRRKVFGRPGFVDAHDARFHQRVVIVGACSAVAAQQVGQIELGELIAFVIQQLHVQFLLYPFAPRDNCILCELNGLLLGVAVRHVGLHTNQRRRDTEDSANLLILEIALLVHLRVGRVYAYPVVVKAKW